MHRLIRLSAGLALATLPLAAQHYVGTQNFEAVPDQFVSVADLRVANGQIAGSLGVCSPGTAAATCIENIPVTGTVSGQTCRMAVIGNGPSAGIVFSATVCTPTRISGSFGGGGALPGVFSLAGPGGAAWTTAAAAPAQTTPATPAFTLYCGQDYNTTRQFGVQMQMQVNNGAGFSGLVNYGAVTSGNVDGSPIVGAGAFSGTRNGNSCSGTDAQGLNFTGTCTATAINANYNIFDGMEQYGSFSLTTAACPAGASLTPTPAPMPAPAPNPVPINRPAPVPAPGDTYQITGVNAGSPTWPGVGQETLSWRHAGTAIAPHTISFWLQLPSGQYQPLSSAISVAPQASGTQGPVAGTVYTDSSVYVNTNLAANTQGTLCARDDKSGKYSCSLRIAVLSGPPLPVPAPAPGPGDNYQIAGVGSGSQTWAPVGQQTLTWSHSGTAIAPHAISFWLQLASGQYQPLTTNISVAPQTSGTQSPVAGTIYTDSSILVSTNLPLNTQGNLCARDEKTVRYVCGGGIRAAGSPFNLAGATVGSNSWTAGSGTYRIAWQSTGSASSSESITVAYQVLTPRTGNVRLASSIPASQGYYDYQGNSLSVSLKNTTGYLILTDSVTGKSVSSVVIQIR